MTSHDESAMNVWMDSAAELISKAESILVCAGAGMGVDSGLPDFRGSEGFWKAYPALGRSGISFEQIACPAAFQSDPSLAWGFDGHRLDLYRRTVPHLGFDLLLKWAAAKPKGIAVITSNVDGQFQKAGFNPDRAHEIHGALGWLQCSGRCCDDIWPADGFNPKVDESTCRLRGPVPQCPRCGAIARPNMKMFGDNDWRFARSEAQASRVSAWMRAAKNPVVIEIGAGTAIPSIRRTSERLAGSFGSGLVRINPRESLVPDGLLAIGLPMGALAALSAIDERMSKHAIQALR